MSEHNGARALSGTPTAAALPSPTPTPEPRPPPERPRRAWLLCLLALTLVAAAYAPALGAPFVWDDHDLIENQLIVRERQPWPTYFTRAFWSDPYDAPGGFFRPLVTLSYALEWRLWSGDPAGFHLTNLLVHLLNCLAVFLLARKGGARLGLALVACLFFGLFPRLSESVAWISGRTDLFAALFTFAAMGLHRAKPDRPGGARVLAAIAILAGLMCKEVALAGAAAIALFELRRLALGEQTPRSMLARLTPLMIAGAVYAFLRLNAMGLGSDGVDPLTRMERIGAALAAVGWYARMLLFPFDPMLQIGHLGFAEGPFLALGLATLLALAIALLRAGRAFWRNPLSDFLAMSAVALLLVLHVIPLDVNVLAADRFLYLPVAGMAIAGSAWRRVPGGRDRRRAAAAILGAILVAFGVATYRQAGLWSDERRLWEEACGGASPHDSGVWMGLANVLDEAGLVEESTRLYAKAIEVARRHPKATGAVIAQSAWTNAIHSLQELDRRDEALLHLAALAGGAASPHQKRNELNLALLRARMGDFGQALAGLDRYIARHPGEEAPIRLRALAREAQARAAPLGEAIRRRPAALTSDEVRRRLEIARLLGDRLSITDLSIEQAKRSDVAVEERAVARETLRQFGLCWRVRERLPEVIDDFFEERCRPLPAALDRMLPRAPLVGRTP